MKIVISVTFSLISACLDEMDTLFSKFGAAYCAIIVCLRIKCIDFNLFGKTTQNCTGLGFESLVFILFWLRARPNIY